MNGDMDSAFFQSMWFGLNLFQGNAVGEHVFVRFEPYSI